LRPGRYAIAPGWLVRAALDGARAADAPLQVGDPYLSWMYQPGVRAFKVPLCGDDLAFLQGGQPAVFVTDSSFSAYYPWYHRAEDTADKLDADALAQMGRTGLGVITALEQVRRGDEDCQWFAAGGFVFGYPALLALGVLSLAPALLVALRTGG